MANISLDRFKEADSAMLIQRDAYRDGRNLSGYLEEHDPSEASDQSDAFDRLMGAAGIVVRSMPEYGIYSNRGADLLDIGDGGLVLFYELAARTYRRAISQRSTMLAGDAVPGSWERPYFDAQAPRWSQEIQAAIPLSELVSSIQPITGEDYRQFYLTTDEEKLRMFRVGESAEIPETVLESAEKTNRLRKYGRAVTASYENFRRMRLDKFTRIVAKIAVQAEKDKIAAAIDYLVNGDGNANTAATSYNLTTLDTAAIAGTMTLKGWLAFMMEFENPYIMTTALCQKAVALQLALLDAGTANTRMIDFGNLPIAGLVPINKDFGATRLGWTSEAPALKIVGLDRRQALEYVTEIGGEIAEIDKFIKSQRHTLVLSEVSNFSVETLFGHAAKILDVNA